jgi:hypothetical protein
MFKTGNPPTPAGQSLKVVKLQARSRAGQANGKGL